MKKLNIILVLLIMTIQLQGQVYGWLRADMYTIPVSEETDSAIARLFWSLGNSTESVITIDSGGVESDFTLGGASGAEPESAVTLRAVRLQTGRHGPEAGSGGSSARGVRRRVVTGWIFS